VPKGSRQVFIFVLEFPMAVGGELVCVVEVLAFEQMNIQHVDGLITDVVSNLDLCALASIELQVIFEITLCTGPNSKVLLM